ncbi:MAG: transposase [Candidatus Woesebacteria bacterium]|nr:transposase [Candidatus Woesebacteria bacterium]
MPSRNSLKVYLANGYYHIYNRGVEKRIIFQDGHDYGVFMKYLKEILLPPDPRKLNTMFTIRGQSYQGVKHPLKNYCDEIDLLAYCLMPNHFHLEIKQNKKDSIEGLMRALMTRYSMYFNKRYGRVGSLFQGRYKAVLIDDEAYIVHLSRYIHLNPVEYTKDLVSAYSSYENYLGNRKDDWVKPEEVLRLFNEKAGIVLKDTNTYKNFVESYAYDSESLLGELTLE